LFCLNKIDFLFYKNTFLFYKNTFFLKNLNFFILDNNFNNFKVYNIFKDSNFFFNIFYSNLFIKFIFNKYFLKNKKKINLFYYFLNVKKNNNFNFKKYFNKSLSKKCHNILISFDFYFLSTLLYFINFYKFYLFLTLTRFLKNNEKKLSNLTFKKRLIISKNVFNLILLDYYYNNLNSLIFLNNLYIFNIFNLNFVLNRDEFFNKNIIVYNNLYPVFKNKNIFFESKFINKNIFNFDKFFNIFILNFYEKLFKSLFFIKLNFNLNLKNYYKNYYKNYPFPASNIQDNYTIDEMFEIFCFSFVNRDINILNN
jgi:hypothetical protein